MSERCYIGGLHWGHNVPEDFKLPEMTDVVMVSREYLLNGANLNLILAWARAAEPRPADAMFSKAEEGK